VFAWGTDASLLHKSSNDVKWTPEEGFEIIGDGLTGPSKSASDAVGSVHVFGYSRYDSLVHKAWNETVGQRTPQAVFDDSGTP
jgi:hypothetical protein